MPEFFTRVNVTQNDSAHIGKGTVIKGSMHSKQDVVLDGQLEGGFLNVENFRLTIGPLGKAVANAKARDIDIYGAIQGNVDSSGTVTIRKGGSLIGDLRTAGIVIEDGAYFKGGVDIVNAGAQAKPAGEA